jgi:hypothetical protein
MSTEEYTTEYDFSDDVSLEPDQKNVGGNKQDWLKMTQKGQVLRAAFVNFYTVDANAVQDAMKASQKSGKKLSREEIAVIAKGALNKRAEELKKTVDQLTAADRLDISKAHFKAQKAHYQEGIGFVLSRLGKDGAEADAVWKRLNDAKPYFITLLLVYPTDSEGALNRENFAAQIKQNKPKLIPWRFGNKVYESIWKLNDGLRENGLSLSSQDFKIECENPQFQNMAVSTAGPAVWQKNEQIKQVVLTAAAAMYDKLSPFRELTTDQLRAKLGLGGGGSSGGGASGADDISSDNFQEMLDSV